MFAWRSLLADLGTRLRFAAVWQIFFAGQLGKYVPGSVWPVIMQMELGVDHDVPRAQAAAATVLQMGLTLATGALLTVATLPFVVATGLRHVTWLAAVVVGVSLAALHPRVANPALRLVFRLLRRQPLEQPLSWRGLLSASALQGAGWVLFAGPVVLISRDLGASGGRLVILAIGAFAASWLAGFLFVLAPAGAGVRETVLVAVLATSMSSAVGLTVALISRLMMTLGDVIVGGIALGAIGRDRLQRLRSRPAEVLAVDLSLSGVRAKDD
jgi:hypothetical protein